MLPSQSRDTLEKVFYPQMTHSLMFTVSDSAVCF